MTKNTSSAVMQQRSEPHTSLDDFPTPPWATRALLDYLHRHDHLIDPGTLVCTEPAANRGHMVKPLEETFGIVRGSDIHDYGAGFPVRDYLFGHAPQTDWTITNPPFRLAEQFIEQACRSSDQGVAVIARTAFLEAVGRYKGLFQRNPPSLVLQFSERVVMHKGKMLDPNMLVKTWSEKKQAFVLRKPSSATAYCWLVWVQGETGTRFDWIAPCRKKMERAEDYL